MALRFEDVFGPGINPFVPGSPLAGNPDNRVNVSKLLTVGPGTPLPIIYGKNRVSGQVIQAEATDQAIVGQQRISLLIALGFGPLNKIGTVQNPNENPQGNILPTLEIDNNPSTDFKDLDISLRHGNLVQSGLPNTKQLLSQLIIGLPLLVSTVFQTIAFTTVNNVYFVQFNISFAGLFFFNLGGPSPAGMNVQYRFKKTTDVAFGPYTFFVVEGLSEGNFIATQRSDVLSGIDRYDFEIKISNGRPSTILSQTGSAFNPILDSVSEFGGFDLEYPLIALIELHSIITQELNSTSPKSVTVEVEGRLVPVWTGTQINTLYSNNPAWVALDLILNPFFGLGNFFNQDNVNLDSFRTWSFFNSFEPTPNVPRHQFNHVFTGDGSVWESFLSVCQMAQASPRFSAGKLEIVVDEDRTSTYFVGQGVIEEDSFSIKYRKKAEVFDAVELPFNNQDIEFDRDQVSARNGSPSFAGMYKTKQLKRLGITKRVEAARTAQFELNKLNSIKRSIVFTMALDGFTLLPGDVFEFAHDDIGLGFSGRLESDSVGLSSFVVDRDMFLLAGSSVILVDIEQDRMETRLVNETGNQAAGATLTTTLPFSFLPLKCSQYSVGLPPSKPFICDFISLTSDFKLKVQAREFIAGVYDDSIDIEDVVYTRLPLPGVSPANVINLAAVSVQRQRADGNLFTTVEVTWDYITIQFNSGIPNAVTAEVYFREAGLEFWRQVTTVQYPASVASIMLELIPGTTYEVTVVPVSTRNNKKHPDVTPRVSVLYTGVTDKPPPPSNLRVLDLVTSFRLTWDAAVSEAFIAAYEVRYGESWAMGTVIHNSLIRDFLFTDFCIPGGAGGIHDVKNVFYVRSRNFAGSHSAHAESAQVDNVIQGSLLLASSGRATAWTEFNDSNVVIQSVSDPTFVLLNGALPGFVGQTGKQFNTGSAVLKHFRVGVKILQYDQIKIWSDPGSWGGTGADDGECRTWEGPLDEIHGTVTCEIATSDDNITYTPFMPDTAIINTTKRYFRVNVTFQTDDNTSYQPRLHEIYVVAETA